MYNNNRVAMRTAVHIMIMDNKHYINTIHNTQYHNTVYMYMLTIVYK